MSNEIGAAPLPDQALAAEVGGITGQNLAECYQCGKCSAGCPAAFAMDILPHQVMRMVQMGRRDPVLSSTAIWLCASCQTCTTRCPKGMDVAGTMDALRQMAWARGARRSAGNVLKFHRSFLDTIRLTGRLFEAGLLGLYKARSGHFLQDITAAPKMIGKLKLFPRRIRGHAEVARLFRSGGEGT